MLEEIRIPFFQMEPSSPHILQIFLHLAYLLDVMEKPGVDPRQLVNPFECHTTAEGLTDEEKPL